MFVYQGNSGVKTPCKYSPFEYRSGIVHKLSCCTLGEVPITWGIRANKTQGSGAEFTAGNPYGL